MGDNGYVMEQNEALLDLILNENPIGAAGTTGEGRVGEWRTKAKEGRGKGEGKDGKQENETEMVSQRCQERPRVDLICVCVES